MMRYAWGNAQEIGQREAQQDSFGFSDPEDRDFCAHGGMLAVVADGMGGLEQGGMASRVAVKAFLGAYLAKSPQEGIADALLRAMGAAQDAVKELARTAKVGTTLVAGVLQQGAVHWIAAGDSAIYLVRGGELTQLNRPHVYALELDERVLAGELTLEAALGDPQREALTSYLGMEQLAAVDRNLRPLTLEPRDGLLLASDGLFKSLPLARFPARAGDAQQYCEQLARAALETAVIGQDNITVVMLEGAPVPAREALGPVLVAEKSKWAQWVVVAGVLVCGVAAAYWAGSREPKRAQPAVVDTSRQVERKERFDTSKLPPVLEPAQP